MKWVKVFESAEDARARVTEGSLQLVVIDGTRICLANVAGNFYAVQDSCPHQGAHLSEGKINYLGEVVCPLHHYQFNLQTGTSRSTRDLKTYPVKVEESGFYIGL